jgi:chromosome segregation ATPase
MNEIKNGIIVFILGFAIGFCTTVFVSNTVGAVDAIRKQFADATGKQQQLDNKYKDASSEVISAADSLQRITNDNAGTIEECLRLVGKIREVSGQIQENNVNVRNYSNDAVDNISG